MSSIRSRTAFGPLASAMLVAAVAACSDGSTTDRDTARTDELTASLLDSRTDPGLGTGPSIPISETTGGMTEVPGAGAPTGAPEDPIDVSQLGFNAGSPDAPVRMVEFSDFGCGYCARFHNEIYPTLVEEYVETGQVEWKYVPIVLGMFGANAELAARAGECAGAQGGFPAMRDRLFADQPEWKPADDPMPLFTRYAEEQGLEMERFVQCLTTSERDARIVAGTRLSRQVGLRGTPTFFILGYAPIPGMLPLELFREVLDTVVVRETAGAGAR